MILMTIIVQFDAVCCCLPFPTKYERRRILKGKEGARVYICDNLTASTAEIARDASQLVEDKRLHSCWTNDSFVFVKRTEAEKPIAVYDHTTLVASC